MNRPKKNKIVNPTLGEDQQDYLDERNLIDVEQADESSFEDKVHVYWMENKGFIITCLLALAGVIIAFNALRILQEFRLNSLQSDYAEAVETESLENFAKDHSGKSLAGVAALEVADQAYSEEDFAKAAEFYEIAKNSFDQQLLSARSMVGLAFATFYSGDEDKGKGLLKEVASNSDLPESARAEAAYHLAIDADLAGNTDQFDRYASQIENIDAGGQWRQRFTNYQRQSR